MRWESGIWRREKLTVTKIILGQKLRVPSLNSPITPDHYKISSSVAELSRASQSRNAARNEESATVARIHLPECALGPTAALHAQCPSPSERGNPPRWEGETTSRRARARKFPPRVAARGFLAVFFGGPGQVGQK